MNEKPTDFRPLSCGSGCSKDRLIHLFEKHFAIQDEAYNLMAEDYINTANFMIEVILPFLESRATKGDIEANEIIYEVHTLLAGKAI